MKKVIKIWVFILITLNSFSQKEKVALYIDIYKGIAMQEMQRTGVPASITLAQGILESKFGQSDLSVRSNNHFGIKCKLDWNGEKVYSDDDTKNECFRKYPSPQDSYKDHSDFLKSRSHYAWLFNLQPNDYQSWAKGLKKSGYATETDYAEKLIGIIEEYNLNQFSLQVINNSFQNANNNIVSYPKFKQPAVKTTVVADEADDSSFNNNVSSTSLKQIENNISYPENVFAINGTKVIYAKTGTSLLALANQYNITLAKLFELNDMKEIDILENNKLIFLEKKQKKGDKDFHIVQPNETLHDIAQSEGVRLDMIAEYNSISEKVYPKVGEKIYLKSKAPIIPQVTSKQSR